MLEEKSISVNNLLLDPNNPRFVSDFRGATKVEDDEIAGKQEEILRRFSKGASLAENDEEDVTNVSDLYHSMLKVGFVPIDRVVVRAMQGSEKFLVIEGNRRVSAAKLLVSDYDKGELKPKERRHLEDMLDSLRTIKCMILPTVGLSQEQIAERVSVILGIRHHGSLLEWGALPKAFNIYNEYMSEEPKEKEFSVDGGKVNNVAGRLSIKPAVVRKALRTYVAYRQLRDRNTEIKDDHFSLIEYAVTDKHLSTAYFKIDGVTYKLDEPSMERMEKLCQFGTRDAIPAGKKVIMERPQSFTQFGRLVGERLRADHEQTKRYADDLIHRVEDEEDIDLTVEGALDNFRDFLNRTQWVEAVRELLEKVSKAELPLEDYSGTGNDRGYKDELKATLEPLRRILGV